MTFDGADYLSEFKVQVRDDKGNLLTEGTDYTVKALKGTKEVSQIVDAGEYTIVVSSDSYQFGSDLKDTEVLRPRSTLPISRPSPSTAPRLRSRPSVCRSRTGSTPVRVSLNTPSPTPGPLSRTRP